MYVCVSARVCMCACVRACVQSDVIIIDVMLGAIG